MNDDELLTLIKAYIKERGASELAYKMGYRNSNVFYFWIKKKRVPGYQRERVACVVTDPSL